MQADVHLLDPGHRLEALFAQFARVQRAYLIDPLTPAPSVEMLPSGRFGSDGGPSSLALWQIGWYCVFGAQPAFISELLPVHLRFSGLGIGREISSVLGGGLSPMIATALLAHYRSATPVAIYLVALALVTVIATLIAPETFPRSARLQARQSAEPVTA